MEDPSPRKQPTFADIAREAGVCKATVSLALRNSNRISEETRQRIKKIAVEMGYHQNPLVTANMLQIRKARQQTLQTPTVGLLSTWVEDGDERKRVEWHIQSRFLEGAKRRSSELGFAFDYLEFDLAKYSSSRIQQVLESRNIAGIVLTPLRFSDSPLRLEWSKFAVTSIGFSDQLGNIPSVYYDNFRCMQHVLEYLSNRGYRRFGFITDSENEMRGGHLWNAGFLEYQHRLIPEGERVPILRIPKSELRFVRDDYEAMLDWRNRNKPVVIIAFRPNIRDFFQSEGLQAPNDFGYMVLNWSTQTDGCSGYRQCHEEMAEVAVDMVSERLYHNTLGELRKPRVTLLQGDIVEGFTTR